MIDLLNFRNSSNFCLERVLDLAMQEVGRRGGLAEVRRRADADSRTENYGIEPARDENAQEEPLYGFTDFLTFLECHELTLIHVFDILSNAIALRGGMAKVRGEAMALERELDGWDYWARDHRPAINSVQGVRA